LTTEITEDTEFAEKRGEEITQGGIRLAAGVMEGLTPGRGELQDREFGGWGTQGRGTGVTDMERVGEEHGGIRKETKEVKEAKEMKEDERDELVIARGRGKKRMGYTRRMDTPLLDLALAREIELAEGEAAVACAKMRKALQAESDSAVEAIAGGMRCIAGRIRR